MSENKTEKPTPKRQKEARKEGNVARTQELGAWAGMLLAAAAMPTLVKYEAGQLVELFHRSLRAVEDPTVPVALHVLSDGARHVFFSIVLLGCGIMLVGVGGALSQGGFYLATKAVKPNLKKLDPIKGMKRIFGPQALWEGVKMTIKCALVAVLVYGSIRAMMPLLGGFVPLGTILSIVGGEATTMVRNVAVAGVVMAGADYLMQRRRVGKQTRMTKDEVKREHKQSEGDPLLKGAIRSRQLAASRNRMMADVTQADVVLVNPTHVAVALKYDESSPAPRVVARGAGVVAQRIREVAAENDVPLVRDVPLARALFTASEVGREIPAELFAAVAQVLAFVISRRTRGQLGGVHGTPRADEPLPDVLPAGRRRPGSIPSGAAAPGR